LKLYYNILNNFLLKKYKRIDIAKYRNESIFLLSQYSTPIVGLLVNLLLLRQISPEIIGIYQSIFLWSTYFTFLSLGVFNGLNRNLSYYSGKEDILKLNTATSSGFIFSILISLVSLIIIISYYNLYITNINIETKFSYLILLVTVITQPIIVYFDTLHKTGQDFAKLGKIIFLTNILYVSTMPIILFVGFQGFMIITILKILFQMSLLYWSKKNVININFSFKIILEQIKIGFPIMLNGYLYTSFFQFDQLYISQHFKPEELGYYNLSRLVITLIAVVPTSIGTLLYPKAAYIYGKHNNNTSKLFPFFKNALLVNILVIIPIIGLTYIFIEPIVNNFLPKYIPGIIYAKLSIIGGIGYIFVGPSIIIGVLNKIWINLSVLLLMSFLSYGLYFLGILHFKNIETLILVKNTVFIVYAIFIIFYIYFTLKFS